MLKNIIDLTSKEAKGLNTNPNIFTLTKDQSPNMMNVKVDHDGSWVKRLGTVTMNTVVIAGSGGVKFTAGSQTLTSNIQAYWKFEEVSGTRFPSFGGIDLSDINDTPSISGRVGRAALFSSSLSNHLLGATSAPVETGDINFSTHAWVYLNSTSTTQERSIISKGAVVDSSVSLLLHFDGEHGSTTFTDASPRQKTFTANSLAQLDTQNKRLGSASGVFNGSGSYINTPFHPDLTLNNQDFTIEFFYRNNSIGLSQYLMGFENVEANSIGWLVHYNQLAVTLIMYDSNQTQTVVSTNSQMVAGEWVHYAFTRQSGTSNCFMQGNLVNTNPNTNFVVFALTSGFSIGKPGDYIAPNAVYGNIDELKIVRGVSLYNSSFTPPEKPYYDENEYNLYVGTDNILGFRVSSSGTLYEGQVRATSFGALNTSTWYSVVAWHDTGNSLGISVNLSATTASYSNGVRAGSAPFVVGANSGGYAGFDGRIDEVGFWKKVLSASERSDLYSGGSGQTVGVGFEIGPWASFDFGAGSNNNRWLVVAAATGTYASSNLGVTWVNIATDRTANYQYFERSKNVLVSGSDSYDTPLYWAGSAGTFMAVLNPSAPLVKYWINHIGFLIGLNSSTRKRGFYWEDENTQLTGDYGDSFDIPSSSDDEITNGFVLRRRLYVSTRYFLYGLDYIGGSPDWNYRKIKDFGFVPRTVKIISLEDGGEVAIGMDWGNKIRLFDGAEDKIISSNVEFDNGICEFALDKASISGSGKTVFFAEVERNENAYRLCLAIGADSTQTTHFLSFNRNQAFYPDDNRPFNTMTSAESNNAQYTMAFDRSGRCHMLDSGNKDFGVTPINDVLDLAYLYDKSPSQAQKNHGLDLFFTNETAGRIYVKESINFDKIFTERDSFVISGTGNKHIFHKTIDTPSETNSYQARITTSGGTNNPWRLLRYDFFTEGLGIGKTE